MPELSDWLSYSEEKEICYFYNILDKMSVSHGDIIFITDKQQKTSFIHLYIAEIQ